MPRRQYWVYLLKCSDSAYYIGMTDNLELRFSQYQTGFDPKSYTASRRPVKLMWAQEFASHDEAFRCERQVKGWSRAKKEALVNNDWDEIHGIVKRERKLRRAIAKNKKNLAP